MELTKSHGDRGANISDQTKSLSLKLLRQDKHTGVPIVFEITGMGRGYSYSKALSEIIF